MPWFSRRGTSKRKGLPASAPKATSADEDATHVQVATDDIDNHEETQEATPLEIAVSTIQRPRSVSPVVPTEPAVVAKTTSMRCFRCKELFESGYELSAKSGEFGCPASITGGSVDDAGDFYFNDPHETAGSLAGQIAADKAAGRGSDTDADVMNERSFNKANSAPALSTAEIQQTAENRKAGHGGYTDAQVADQRAANVGRFSDAEVAQRTTNDNAGRGLFTNRELRQLATNEGAGRGAITDAQVSKQKMANMKAGKGDFSHSEVIQISENAAAGFGAVTSAVADQERLQNRAEGEGRYTHEEQKQRMANKHAAKGKYTHAETLQREANDAAGKGLKTDAELATAPKSPTKVQLAAQRPYNDGLGRGWVTDAEASKQRKNNDFDGNGFYTDAELVQCKANKLLGRGFITNGELERRQTLKRSKKRPGIAGQYGDLAIKEEAQRVSNSAAGRGFVTNGEVAAEQAANSLDGNGEYTDFEVDQIVANVSEDLGRFTDAEIDQIASNDHAGRGKYTDKQVKEILENKYNGVGEYTNAELALRAANNAAGLGNLTAIESLQCTTNASHGYGEITNATAAEQRVSNKAMGLGAVTNAEIKTALKRKNAKARSALLAILPDTGEEDMAGVLSVYTGDIFTALDDGKRRGSFQERLAEAQMTKAVHWIAAALPKIGDGDKAAKAAVLRILGHCHTFAAADDNVGPAAKLYSVLTKAADKKLQCMPAEAHAKAMEMNLCDSGPQFKKVASKWSRRDESPATAPKRVSNQVEVVPFLSPDNDKDITAIAKEKGLSVAELKVAMLLIVGIQVDKELDSVLAGFAAGKGEIKKAPLKRMDRVIAKAAELYSGDIGKVFDIVRRSFVGKDTVDHLGFADPMIPEAVAEGGEVMFWDGATSKLTAVSIRDGMGLEKAKATAKMTLINAEFHSSATTYADLVKKAKGLTSKRDDDFEIYRKKNRAPFRLWSAAIQALSLPAFASQKIALVVEVQLFYPEFYAAKDAAEVLVAIIRAATLSNISKNCARFATNKDLAYRVPPKSKPVLTAAQASIRLSKALSVRSASGPTDELSALLAARKQSVERSSGEARTPVQPAAVKRDGGSEAAVVAAKPTRARFPKTGDPQ
jgi:hypothetical protein